MATKISLLVVSFVLCAACGGGQTTSETPEETASPAEGGGDSEAAPAETSKPADGIVRDADGDGVSDDKQAGACAGKNETQCKINSNCAWSDSGKCVDAGSE
jgi:hypothetical protein